MLRRARTNDPEAALILEKLPEIILLRLGIPYEVIIEMDEEEIEKYLALLMAFEEYMNEMKNA